MRTRTRYAPDTMVATGHDPKVRSNTLPPTTIGEKRSRSQGDPGHDVQKHPRRKGSPVEGVSLFPRVLRLRVPSPLQQILVLATTTTPLQDILHMELVVPLLIEQRR